MAHGADHGDDLVDRNRLDVLDGDDGGDHDARDTRVSVKENSRQADEKVDNEDYYDELTPYSNDIAHHPAEWMIDRGIDGEDYNEKMRTTRRYGHAKPSRRSCNEAMDSSDYSDEMLACFLNLNFAEVSDLNR